MSKLRVLHVIGGGEFGGAEQHILNLVSTFSVEEVEVAVVCFYDSLFASKLRQAGITVFTLNQFGRFDLRLLRALRNTFHAFQPAIIHTHGVKANFFSRLAARGLRVPMLTTVHSSLRYDYSSPLAYAIVNLMERSTRQWNQHYIAISEALASILREQGVASRDISVIYNGMDLSPYRQHQLREEDRTRLRTEWELPQDAFVFATVARFVPVKGLPVLVDAFSKFAANTASSPYLVLVGDGPEREGLEAQVRKLGLEARVRFAGFRQDIPACLHACDAFVHSSFYEGLGYTIIEAMASEVPVIASNVGGVKEFVFHEDTGLVVEPGDPSALSGAMEKLLNSPELSDAMVQRALSRVERSFTIEKMTEQIVSLYRKMLH
ncbi:glycosyltransferase [Brevibacillus centrosporus]|uniref:glycosyltransferase n=1 Tax=Brevibacillus centrosporus TaxID=54910 RepID=UPI000B8200DE|nr:glycosyltransferase [Brevibacillus centrosporus]MEC2131575.1 glycosyltransferase [Brevibacillus centrosporus]RNB72067.1 glycosyltransferase [Brevibacillus centrosporus]GED32592.1 glycosyl transferase [Brevibacillus centrosporus]